MLSRLYAQYFKEEALASQRQTHSPSHCWKSPCFGEIRFCDAVLLQEGEMETSHGVPIEVGDTVRKCGEWCGEMLAACSCKTSQRERRWERRDLGARRMFPYFFIPPVFRQTELHVQTNRGASPVLVSIKFFSCEYKVEGEGVVTAVVTAVFGIFSAHCLCLWNNITIFKGMKAKFALIKLISMCYKQMYFVKTTKLTLKYYCISWLEVHLHHS